MLVLSRKAQQAITIGDNITVTILEVRNGKVRIGIDAPLEMNIGRESAIPYVPKDQTDLTPNPPSE